MSQLTKLEWSILDSLSDDEETVGLIISAINGNFPDISSREVAKSIYKLYQQGLVSEDNHKDIDLQTLITETIDYRNNVYWFGLTEVGGKYWEEYAPIYGGEPIDWSQSYVGHFNLDQEDGYIDGVSLEVCLQGLEKIDTEKDWQVDRSTLANSKIEGFKAKYYKYIPSGCRVIFKLKKRNLN